MKAKRALVRNKNQNHPNECVVLRLTKHHRGGGWARFTAGLEVTAGPVARYDVEAMAAG
jgi:hypothetical protein